QQPNYFGALHLLGVIALQTRRTERAVELIGRAIGLNAKVAAAHSNLGNALKDLMRPEEALASYDRAIALKPDYAEAHSNRGSVFGKMRRYNEAFAAYSQALALNPDLIGVEGARFHAKMHTCDWSNFDAECAHLLSSVRNRNINTSPFPLL